MNTPPTAGYRTATVRLDTRSPFLLTLSGDHAGKVHPLSPVGATTIGRNRHVCEIALRSRLVSREHARIEPVEGGYALRDLDSRGGTYLNERPVRGTPARLAEGDAIRISDEYVFIFHEGIAAGRDEDSGIESLVLHRAEVDSLSLSHSHSTSTSTASTAPGAASGAGREADLLRKLNALAEISSNLVTLLDEDRILDAATRTLFHVFPGADRAILVSREEERSDFAPRMIRFNRPGLKSTRVSHALLTQAVEGRVALLIRDVTRDRDLGIRESVRDSHMRTVMCAPLIDRSGRVTAVLQVDTLERRSAFRQDDLDVLAVIANQLSIALQNARMHARLLREAKRDAEEEHARRVQTCFLPRGSPTVPGYDLHDHYAPARRLSGDYFAYLPIGSPEGDGRRLGVILADVSGKGLPAALMMANLAAEARACCAAHSEPTRIVEALNARFHRESAGGMFATLALAVLDRERHEVSVVRAGHPSPLLVRAGGSVEEIGEDRGGPPLGMDPGHRYEATRIALEPNDWLLLYTDGVTEAEGSPMDAAGTNDGEFGPEPESVYGAREMFGEVRLIGSLEDWDRTGGAAGLVARVLADLREFAGRTPQSDDLTLVCLGRRGG